MKQLISAMLILFLVSAPVYSQSKESTVEKIDELFKHSHDYGVFNGAVLVSQNGEVIYKNAFGYADKAAERKLNTESAFYLASVSKQFTTMCAMILKEQGKLSFDDTLDKFFSEYSDYAKTITVKHLMTHTSGIPDHYRLGIYKPGLTNEDVLNLLVKQELDFEPGAQYQYSNGGYVTLAILIERVSGMALADFMKQHVFDPLNMKRSLVYTPKTPAIKNRAIGYNANGNLDDYAIYTTGAGGLYSTVEDLYKWDQALYTEKLVSKATLEEAFSPTVLNDGEISDYGYGWGIMMDDDKKSVGHTGSLSGFRTVNKRNIYENSGYIMLTNFGNTFEIRSIRTALDHILKNEPYELPRKPITPEVAAMVDSNSSEELITKAKALLAENPDNRADEFPLNAMGYDYLGSDDVDNALKVFELNAALFPDSFNVYDSLAEAQLAKGDSTAAEMNYKKSYTINKANSNAIDMLNKMGVDTTELTADPVIADEILQTYVGKYELMPNFILDISLKEGQLYIHPTGQNISKIFPSSETRFYSKIVDAQLTFNKDDSGNVIGLTLHQNGNHEAKRIE